MPVSDKGRESSYVNSVECQISCLITSGRIGWDSREKTMKRHTHSAAMFQAGFIRP